MLIVPMETPPSLGEHTKLLQDQSATTIYKQTSKHKRADK